MTHFPEKRGPHCIHGKANVPTQFTDPRRPAIPPAPPGHLGSQGHCPSGTNLCCFPERLHVCLPERAEDTESLKWRESLREMGLRLGVAGGGT